MSKSRVILTLVEALSGVLSVIALIGNFAMDAKDTTKQIGCDENAGKTN